MKSLAVALTACCVYASAACADDKVYLDCSGTAQRSDKLQSYPTKLSMVIDLRRGIIAGDFESTITHVSQGTVEFQGKEREGEVFALKANRTWEGSLDRVTGSLSISEGMDEMHDPAPGSDLPLEKKRIRTSYDLKCNRLARPIF